MHRGVIWPALISGLAISGLSDTGVSPGRRFQPLIVGLAMAIWALTHFVGHDSRDPPGLTLAHQPAHSDHTPMQPAMGSRASGSYRQADVALVVYSRSSLAQALPHSGQ